MQTWSRGATTGAVAGGMASDKVEAIEHFLHWSRHCRDIVRSTIKLFGEDATYVWISADLGIALGLAHFTVRAVAGLHAVDEGVVALGALD